MHIDMDSIESLQNGVKRLQQDHDNGARVLARFSLELLRDVIQEMRAVDMSDDAVWSLLLACSLKLQQARPSMSAAITSALCQALSRVKVFWKENPDILSRRGSTGNSAFLMADKAILETIIELNASSYCLSEKFCEWMRFSCLEERPVKILTLSSSTSILDCLTRTIIERPEIRLDIRILESRPRFEGALFARSLERGIRHSDTGLPNPDVHIQVAPDSHLALLANNIDFVLLGADRITGSGDVSNKMGSLAAVLCAKALSPYAKVVVVAETGKIVADSGTEAHLVEENDILEVTEAWEGTLSMQQVAESGIQIRNVYFEWVEGKLIDMYLCEKGTWGKQEVLAQSERREKIEREIFTSSTKDLPHRGPPSPTMTDLLSDIKSNVILD